MKKKTHVISFVEPGSIADQLELCAGDILLAMNGNEIEDILDYQFYEEEEELLLLVRKADGEEWELEISKEYKEPLGLTFENGLMDEYRSCSNKCIFCFIDQMPPGMRDTLYFKDDDARLSFLQGNYITLTNMKEKDMERVVRYHLSPINISVQTTNPELRVKMLHNRFAGEALKKIDYFFENGIEMNGQVVLCKGFNDGEELRRTITDLMRYCPVMRSVSIVPVGLTKFREGLCPLKPLTKEDAEKTIEMVEGFQQECMEKYGLHFVHLSDEFYILAERELPTEENYDGYCQLENGVGMLRLLLDETKDALSLMEGDDHGDSITIATGKLAYPYLSHCVEETLKKFPNLSVKVIPITNHFFGELITVSGLITGRDLIDQLKGKAAGRVLIPINMLRSGEEVFLDDVTLDMVRSSLGLSVAPVKNSGYDLVEALTGKTLLRPTHRTFRPYELTEDEDLEMFDDYDFVFDPDFGE